MLKRAAAGFGVIAGLLAATGGHGATLRATPSLAIEGSWDSNVFNAGSGEVSDFVYRGTPALAFSFESPRTTFTLTGSVTGEWYDRNRDLNTWDATKRAELSAPVLKISPGMAMRAAARYVETNDLWNRNELVLSPIPDLPPAETIVVGRTRSRIVGGSLQVTDNVTPNIGLGIGGGATEIAYLGEAGGLVDSRTATGNVSARYRISPRATSGVTGSTGYTSRGDGSSSRSYGAGLTGSFAVSAKTSVEAGGGMTFLANSDVNGTTTHDRSPYGQLTISHNDRGVSAALAGSYEMTGGGSLGQATERTNANFTITDELTPKWVLDGRGYYQIEQTADRAASQRIATAGGTLGVRYAAAAWATLRLAGSTFRQWNHGIVGTNVTRSQVQLLLTLSEVYSIF